MALPVIYWRGGEDIDYVFTQNTQLNGSGFQFRSGYARCCISPANLSNGWAFARNPWNSGSGAVNFWFGSYLVANNLVNTNGNVILWFYDTAQVLRFYVQCTGTNTCNVFKRTLAGAATLLGSFNENMSANVLYKWDVQVIQDAVNGLFQIWIAQNGSVPVLVFNFLGDTTTDSSTHNIAYHALGNGLSGQISYSWSEQIVSDSDTRSMGLVTLAPVANGNTHNFDVGSPAAANVNEVSVNRATIDAASVAGLIDQYTIGSLPSGNLQILDVAITAEMEKGFSGPSKMDIGVRSGGSDFWSPDQTLSTVWASFTYNWNTDPNTSAAWAALPTNIGLKSVT